ncbi:o-succinylbenzoate synthase [Arthrobacter sp. GMC3]|uniref:o-succinylbenzoate synthase n=1 Tax=Arthrobacter sp. GMC3 TaxID=2058894 RepID=UPI000CE357B3|nr:o-succinylbenzoate synthase [Arthrobacter sp. GMC3]
MRILNVELITVSLPLVSPFTTSFSTQTQRSPLLIKLTADVDGDVVVGWGECVTLQDPLYSEEYLDGARDVLRRYLIPRLYAWQDAGNSLSAETVGHVLRHIVGHRMAKAALEMAVLDAQLRASGQSFASYFGATVNSVPSGVSVGIENSIEHLLEVVGDFLDQGYVRIKLKIKPGWDIAPVRAVREKFGDIPLQVDANAAYTLVDAPLLRQLDAFDLLLIEQPLAEDDLRQHALLAKQMSTPMCLDESIVSATAAADAIALGAVDVINIKPGRVGGYLEARRIHDIAAANGIAVWCGGMLESGLGRAANAALAGMSGFTLPGDISASDRFYKLDITEPFVLDGGRIAIPTGPGLGVEPLPEVLKDLTVHTETVSN